MKYPKPLSAFLLAVLLAGCSTPPWGGTAKPEGVPLVILDTDIGSSTDDLFALEMLFRYEEAGSWAVRSQTPRSRNTTPSGNRTAERSTSTAPSP